MGKHVERLMLFRYSGEQKTELFLSLHSLSASVYFASCYLSYWFTPTKNEKQHIRSWSFSSTKSCYTSILQIVSHVFVTKMSEENSSMCFLSCLHHSFTHFLLAHRIAVFNIVLLLRVRFFTLSLARVPVNNSQQLPHRHLFLRIISTLLRIHFHLEASFFGANVKQSSLSCSFADENEKSLFSPFRLSTNETFVCALCEMLKGTKNEKRREKLFALMKLLMMRFFPFKVSFFFINPSSHAQIAARLYIWHESKLKSRTQQTSCLSEREWNLHSCRLKWFVKLRCETYSILLPFKLVSSSSSITVIAHRCWAASTRSL